MVEKGAVGSIHEGVMRREEGSKQRYAHTIYMASLYVYLRMRNTY